MSQSAWRGDEHEIADLVEAALGEGMGDFIEVEAPAEIAADLENRPRIAAREGFPQRFGEFEAGHGVEAVGEVAHDGGEILKAGARQQEDVGVGVQDPMISRVGAAQGDIARRRFDHHQVRVAADQALVQFRAARGGRAGGLWPGA